MAFHRFVTIDGTRHDITDLAVIDERSCDRCGAFVRARVQVTVPAEFTPSFGGPNIIELCEGCTHNSFPGLFDLARKVHARA